MGAALPNVHAYPYFIFFRLVAVLRGSAPSPAHPPAPPRVARGCLAIAGRLSPGSVFGQSGAEMSAVCRVQCTQCTQCSHGSAEGAGYPA